MNLRGVRAVAACSMRDAKEAFLQNHPNAEITDVQYCLDPYYQQFKDALEDFIIATTALQIR